jgi:hypothetical protein
MSEAPDVYRELVFWEQIKGDAKRVILCEPDRVDEIRAAVEERRCEAILTVRGSEHCPPGQLIVIDQGALEAVSRQAAQRAAKDLRLR